MDNLNYKPRARGRLENRPFGCGCGKDYLSYAALYTHIKTKHEGNAPEGTSQVHMKVKRGRGRPRKSALKEITSINNIISYDSEATILEESGLLGVTEDPMFIFESEESPIYRKCQYWSTEEKENEENLTCDDVFALYLIDLANSIAPEGFKQFGRYLHHFRECLNLHGSEVLGVCATEYSSHMDPHDLPNMFNFFIVEFLPKLKQADREDGIVFSLQFCMWLYSKQYTTYKLNLIDYSKISD